MYELQVKGMSCGGCARNVTKLVQSVDSKAKVEVDLAGKKVRVESDAGLESIAAAISGAGYPVMATAAS
jgi:copper chaperone